MSGAVVPENTEGSSAETLSQNDSSSCVDEKLTPVLVNGTLEETSTTSPSDCTGTQKKLSTDAYKESEQSLSNGIEKCNAVELPDLCDKVSLETNGENHSSEETSVESVSPTENSAQNLSSDVNGKTSHQECGGANGVSRNDDDLKSAIKPSDNPECTDSENGSINSASEKTDNIFEKFHHTIGKDNVEANDTNGDDKTESENKKCVLTLQIDKRESLKGLIKAAASNVGNRQSSTDCDDNASVNESNGTLAEQCGDVTSTSKVDQTVLSNPDKGNLFENLSRVESPMKGSTEESSPKDASNDNSEPLKVQICEKVDQKESAAEESTDTSSKKAEKSSSYEEQKSNQNEYYINPQVETLFNPNVLLEGDLSDIDDSALDQEEDDSRNLNKNESETVTTDEKKNIFPVSKINDVTLNVSKDEDDGKGKSDNKIPHINANDITVEEIMDTDDSSTKQPDFKANEISAATPTDEERDKSDPTVPNELEDNGSGKLQDCDRTLSEKDDKILQDISKTGKITSGISVSAKPVDINPNGKLDNPESDDKSSKLIKEKAMSVTESNCTKDNNIDNRKVAQSGFLKHEEEIDDCKTNTAKKRLEDQEIKNEETDANIEMDIDTQREEKIKSDTKDDIFNQEYTSDKIAPKMDSEDIPEVKPETEVKMVEIQNTTLRKSESCENIPESRKRAADSPMKEEGTGKKSRLENVVGGLMSRLGKDMSFLTESTGLSDTSSESELTLSDGPHKEITVKKLQSLMKTHLKMTIENHRSSATIVQLQKKLVSLQAEIESWKSTALTLEEQVKQLTKSSSRHDKKRGRTKSTAVQADEAKIKATAQGLATSGKPPNGVVSPSNSQQAVVVGGKVVTATSPGATVPPGSVQVKTAADRRSSLTVREMLDEQRGVISSKAVAVSHQAVTTNTGTTTPSTTSSDNTSANKGGGNTSNMVVDLTEDDDPNSPSKSAANAKANMPHPALTNTVGSVRPIIPAAALPAGIRPGTYLLQQNPGGGTVLQQIVSPQQMSQQQGHTVVIGTQGGPAVLLQTPPGVSSAGSTGTVLRQANPSLPQPKLRAGNTNQMLVKHQQGVRPPPPLQSAPPHQLHHSRPSLSPTKKTTARKRTAPPTSQSKKSRTSQSQGGGDSSPDCDVMITTVHKPTPAKCHPAPLPPQPTSQASGNGLKLLPPKPTLKISRVSQGIVLSWNVLNLTDKFEDIINYQLFAYQEGSAVPSALLWKKVGDVKALPLPMACTLTQFQEGNRYHFAVRAMDKYQRVGPFSEPSSIHLSGKS